MRTNFPAWQRVLIMLATYASSTCSTNSHDQTKSYFSEAMNDPSQKSCFTTRSGITLSRMACSDPSTPSTVHPSCRKNFVECPSPQPTSNTDETWHSFTNHVQRVGYQ